MHSRCVNFHAHFHLIHFLIARFISSVASHHTYTLQTASFLLVCNPATPSWPHAACMSHSLTTTSPHTNSFLHPLLFHDTQGHRFDPESSMTLRIELAKHNSNRKRSRADSESDSLRHYPPSGQYASTHHCTPCILFLTRTHTHQFTLSLSSTHMFS